MTIRTQAEKVSDTCGTTLRNKAIVILNKAGMSRFEIASLWEVHGHKMTRQQISQIIRRNNGNNAVVCK
jgi:hypothetical protein